MQCINLGGTAEADYGFCPLSGTGAFFHVRMELKEGKKQ